MKTMKVIILILFFCNSLFTLTAQECKANLEIITLTSYPIKTKDSSGSTSEEGLPIKRSIQRAMAEAYLYDNILNINFNEMIEAINVTITNEITGATIYAEVHNNPTTINIELSNEDKGNYIIEIDSKDFITIGHFSL